MEGDREKCIEAGMKTHPEIAMNVLPVVVKRFRETNEMLLAVSST